MKTKAMTISTPLLHTIASALLLIVSSLIVIPLPFTPVPLVMRNIAFPFIALFSTPRQMMITLGSYLVLSNALATLFSASFLGLSLSLPTAGYVVGYFLSSMWVSYMHTHKKLSHQNALLSGAALILLCGWLYLSLLIGPGKAFSLGVMPFLGMDLLKVFLVSRLCEKTKEELL